MDEGELERFFGSLNASLEEAAVAAQRELERFCNELAPRLETARTLEAELDRELARKFNAFDYLRTDEMGLSRVIADLLNPKGKHGQGTAFLQLLLRKLEFDVGGDLQSSKVHTELSTEDGRIDIVVEMGSACLAIENKPYAIDQPAQIERYLRWLRKEYSNFRLIYLPPTGAPPSEESVGDELEEHDKTFCIMPYHNVKGSVWEDSFKDFRTNFGLTDWLKECRIHCDVERLRWFLRDAETFCERRFGGNAMTNREIETVKKFVLENERNWETARAIHGALAGIDTAVREQFLETIANGVQGLEHKFIVEHNYHAGAWRSWVRASSKHWREHGKPPYPKWARVHLTLEASKHQGNGWFFAIRMPARKLKMSQDGRERLTEIEQQLTAVSKLPSQDDPQCAWSEFVDEPYRDWDALIPAIHAELQEKDGKTPITDYFIKKFAEVAEFAVPILDEIEGT